MSYTVAELLALTPEQIDEMYAKEELVCGACKKPIVNEQPLEKRYIDDKRVHEDCYFDELGKLVEEHPIVTPHAVVEPEPVGIQICTICNKPIIIADECLKHFKEGKRVHGVCDNEEIGSFIEEHPIGRPGHH